MGGNSEDKAHIIMMNLIDEKDEMIKKLEARVEALEGQMRRVFDVGPQWEERIKALEDALKDWRQLSEHLAALEEWVAHHQPIIQRLVRRAAFPDSIDPDDAVQRCVHGNHAMSREPCPECAADRREAMNDDA